MLNKLFLGFYNTVPYNLRNAIGKSRFLRPLREFFLRSKGSFKEAKVYVQRNYLNYKVNFSFYASFKVASKAQKKGIENTILRNSITLVKNIKNKKDEAIVFDVGANFGYLSLVWSQSISRNGKVIAFEPNVNVYNSFMKSITANKLQPLIDLKNLAVGEHEGRVELFLNSTTSNTLKGDVQTNNSSTSIKMVSLDSFSNNNSIDQCDLVKIDVDGIELDILMGARELIKRCSPIFIVETNNDLLILDFFKKNNYEILDMALKPISSTHCLPPNIFCIPKTN